MLAWTYSVNNLIFLPLDRYTLYCRIFESSKCFKNENKNIDEQQKCMILFMHTHKYCILKTANYTGVSIDVSFCKLQERR